MAARRTVNPFVLLLLAVAVNLAVFVMAPLLTSGRRPPQDISDPVGISLVSLEAPEPAQEKEVEEVKREDPTPPPDFTPDLFRPQMSSTPGLDMGIAINLGGVGKMEGNTDFIFEAFELDQPPQPVVRIPPVYPYKAREQGIEGVVQVKVLVYPDGTVGQVLILGARPPGIFEDSVRRAVPQWKFSPGKISGEPVKAWVVTTLKFDLGN